MVIISSFQKYLVFTLLLASASSFAWDTSKTVSQDDQKPVQQTQDLLKNRKAVEDFAKSNPAAQQALDEVNKVGGTQQNSDAMFAVSADIIQSLVAESGGDPAKMQKLLEEAQKNPEKFFNNLSPEQKSKIKGISQNVEKNQSPVK